MDNWNKIETVPTVDALVKEEVPAVVEAIETDIVETEVIETTVDESPISAPDVEVEPLVVNTSKEDDVVLYAIKDLSTPSGLSIAKGYSKVSIKDAKEFLEYKSIRKASTEEIKTYFNK